MGSLLVAEQNDAFAYLCILRFQGLVYRLEGDFRSLGVSWARCLELAVRGTENRAWGCGAGGAWKTLPLCLALPVSLGGRGRWHLCD